MLEVTATNLPRLLTCNGSRLLERVPSADIEDTVKDEGNAADWFIQQVFTGQHLSEEFVGRKAPNGVYITEEMHEHLQEYLDWVLHKGQIEKDCSYQSEGIWRVKGRADHIWYDDHTGRLTVSDFKYGWKIVDVEENWTLISHAVGWMLQHGVQPTEVEFRIFQPRPYHPEGTMRSYRMDGYTLGARYNHINTILSNPTDQLQTSKHCYRCPSMAICPAAQMTGMAVLDVAYKAFNSEPSNEHLEMLIEETKKAQEILKQNLQAYEDLAIHRLKQGQHMKNYTVQTGYGRETWQEGITPELIEMLTGVDISKKVLPTPKQSKLPSEILSSLTTRPSKGATLVRMNASKVAEELFNKK